MERLTKREYGEISCNEKEIPCSSFCNNCSQGTGNCEIVKEMVEKLADYEDLDEQGKLVKLPCKEIYLSSGDCVYLIYDYEIVECVHCGVELCADGKIWINLACNEDIFPFRSPDPENDLDPTDWCTNTTCVEISEWAKSIFLTKSEAEAKLKELRGEK